MNRLLAILLVAAAFLTLGLAGNGHAEMDYEVKQTISLGQNVIDLAASADGKYLYVLQQDGTLNVYTGSGQLKETLKVGPSVSKIAVSPDGSLLYLTEKGSKAVKIAEVSYMATIDTVGSPFKGAADAPVVIAVYSDFQ
jgi:DNA-binding beta-propeller fold protein YncE